MANTSTIAFFVIAGFVVFVTVRGELPAYLCVIGLGSNCPTPGATQQGPVAGGTNTVTSSSSSTNSGSNSGVTSTLNPGSPGNTGSTGNPINTTSVICPPGFFYDAILGCYDPTSGSDGDGNCGGEGCYGNDPVEESLLSFNSGLL